MVNVEELVRLELKKSDLTNKTKKQIDSYIEELYIMANLMNETNECKYEPKVGIFWFNNKSKQLLDVFSEDLDTAIDKCPKTNEVTCGKLHKDVWKKALFVAISRKEDESIKLHSQNYMDIPRGRVFYNKTENKFLIKVGDWIDDFPEAKDLIINAFELNDSSYEILKDYHWNIGNGWEI